MIKLFIFESVDDVRNFEKVDVVDTSRNTEPTNVVVPKSPAPEPEPEDEKEVARPRVKKKKQASEKKAVRQNDNSSLSELIGLVDRGEIKAKEAAARHGVSITTWYQLKSDHKRRANSSSPKQSDAKEERRAPLNPDEIREQVHQLQEQGLDSLRIAQKLRISLKDVNKYWNGDLAVSAATADADDEAEEDEEPDFRE
jgi:hypothetical protein